MEWYDEVDEVVNAYRRLYGRSPESTRYYHGVPSTWGVPSAARIVQQLYDDKEHKELIVNKLKTMKPHQIRKGLDVSSQVYLFMHVAAARPYLDYDSFPAQAKAEIFQKNPDLFDVLYDPAEASKDLNRAILRTVSGKSATEYLATFSDDGLRDLMHTSINDLQGVLMTVKFNPRQRLAKRLLRLFDCSKVRNQSYLRGFITHYPWMMQKQTLEQMKASPIKEETWARILAELDVKDRAHFPPGTAGWVKRAIFTKKLKGRNFKAFKSFEEGLPLDPEIKE